MFECVLLGGTEGVHMSIVKNSHNPLLPKSRKSATHIGHGQCSCLSGIGDVILEDC